MSIKAELYDNGLYGGAFPSAMVPTVPFPTSSVPPSLNHHPHSVGFSSGFQPFSQPPTPTSTPISPNFFPQLAPPPAILPPSVPSVSRVQDQHLHHHHHNPYQHHLHLDTKPVISFDGNPHSTSFPHMAATHYPAPSFDGHSVFPTPPSPQFSPQQPPIPFRHSGPPRLPPPSPHLDGSFPSSYHPVPPFHAVDSNLPSHFLSPLGPPRSLPAPLAPPQPLPPPLPPPLGHSFHDPVNQQYRQPSNTHDFSSPRCVDVKPDIPAVSAYDLNHSIYIPPNPTAPTTTYEDPNRAPFATNVTQRQSFSWFEKDSGLVDSKPGSNVPTKGGFLSYQPNSDSAEKDVSPQTSDSTSDRGSSATHVQSNDAHQTIPLINLEEELLEEIFATPLTSSRADATLPESSATADDGTESIATKSATVAASFVSCSPVTIPPSEERVSGSTPNASQGSWSRRNFEDDANQMFIDLKYVPSPSNDRDDGADNDAGALTGASDDTSASKNSGTLQDGKSVDAGQEESEALIKSERAMRLAFPDSTVGDDEPVDSNVVVGDALPGTTKRFDVDGDGLHFFDDDELEAAAVAGCPSGYAQETHTRLVADPVKVGRHHDGRPRAHDPFVCYLCADESADSAGLFAHVRMSHSDVWTDSVCPICGKQFMEKAGVAQHFDLVHLKLRPYKCDICHAWWGFAKHDVMRHKNAVHFRATSIYECTLCTSIFHTDLNLRNHYKAKHNCRIRFKGHFGPEVEMVIPRFPTGAERVTGNPNKESRLVEWSPEMAALSSRKRKASGTSLPSFPQPPPSSLFDLQIAINGVKREVPFPSPLPLPPSSIASKPTTPPDQRHDELLLFECAQCGNKYGHKDLIKFHLMKKHDVPEVDFQASDLLRKVLSPYNRFCKSVYETVRRNFPDLPNTEHSKIVGNMWREMSDVEKEKYHDEHEMERAQLQAVVERCEKMWIVKHMCTKCDNLFGSDAELTFHTHICAGRIEGTPTD